MKNDPIQSTQQTDFDVIVVGAGIGGLYAIHRFREMGLSVLALESAKGVGGVWFHNRYPGARVDVESTDYSYHFSPDLYKEWEWSERYAAQPELLRYLNYVADRFALRRHILFETPLTRARWAPDEGRYHVVAGADRKLTCQFLVMATGNLSDARAPAFPGLADFKGEWVQTSHWPDRAVEFAGRRVAVIGTGSSGVQAAPVIAEQADHLYVFQRSPNFSVPARNGPADKQKFNDIKADVPSRRAHLMTTRAAFLNDLGTAKPFAEYTPAEQKARLDRQWAMGGQGMNRVFGDQGTDAAVNAVVSEFVRSKIREIVKDQSVAEQLCPKDHPIGSRRLCVDTDYYKTYNRENVTLVNIAGDPIEKITPTGIQTKSGAHCEVDLIVFALGFNAFRGAMERVDIRNENGVTPTAHWARGPQTLLGIMTTGFPNYFFLTGPGSPSVLSNMVIMNEEHVNWIADLIHYMRENGFDTVEPTETAQDRWGGVVAEAASKLLRLKVKNYMVHVNEDDGSRVFMPYTGGVDSYARLASEIADNDYDGFIFKCLEQSAASEQAPSKARQGHAS